MSKSAGNSVMGTTAISSFFCEIMQNKIFFFNFTLYELSWEMMLLLIELIEKEGKTSQIRTLMMT